MSFPRTALPSRSLKAGGSLLCLGLVSLSLAYSYSYINHAAQKEQPEMVLGRLGLVTVNCNSPVGILSSGLDFELLRLV
jgi:hypothetical protein